MKKDIKIIVEKDIPIPDSKRTGWTTEAAEKFIGMKPGDSFFIETLARCCCFRIKAKQNKWTFTIRKVESGWRVWKLNGVK